MSPKSGVYNNVSYPLINDGYIVSKIDKRVDELVRCKCSVLLLSFYLKKGWFQDDRVWESWKIVVSVDSEGGNGGNGNNGDSEGGNVGDNKGNSDKWGDKWDDKWGDDNADNNKWADKGNNKWADKWGDKGGSDKGNNKGDGGNGDNGGKWNDNEGGINSGFKLGVDFRDSTGFKGHGFKELAVLDDKNEHHLSGDGLNSKGDHSKDNSKGDNSKDFKHPLNPSFEHKSKHDSSFEQNMFKIINIIDSNKHHIPPITSLDSAPFPFKLSVVKSDNDESWGDYIKKIL